MPNERSRSPSCAAAVASAPPPSTRGLRRSLPPAASSRWMTVIASSADDHHARGDNGPTVAATSHFRFPSAPTACGNGKWEAAVVGGRWRLPGACIRGHPLAFHSLVRPLRSILPSRPLDPKAGARSGGQGWPAAASGSPTASGLLDGREHDGTLARHGHGRSPLRSMTLDRRAR